jgi:hypothetical protein
MPSFILNLDLMLESGILCVANEPLAGVAELADAHDSKSCSVRNEGSSPSFGTKIIPRTLPGWVLTRNAFFS